MGTASLAMGVLALLGNLAFFLNNGQPAGVFWGAVVAAILAVALGAMSRPHRHGRLGLVLGLVSVVISLGMFLFLVGLSGGTTTEVP